MGCRVSVEGHIVGILTFDALDPEAFDDVDDDTVALLAALAGAAIHNSLLAGALEHVAVLDRFVAKQLVREALARAGGQLLGTSTGMVQLRHEIEVLALSDLTTLVTGETGVGKELVAMRST